MHIAGAEEVEATVEVEAAEDIETAAVEVDAAAAEFEVYARVSQELAGILA